ncbi:hypothetical protein ACLOJK_010356 [Asimina triloba]
MYDAKRTCLVFEASAKGKAKSATREFLLREFSAVAGAITITCLMVANLVGYVIGPSGINWLISRLRQKDGLPVVGGIFMTFYVGTKSTAAARGNCHPSSVVNDNSMKNSSASHFDIIAKMERNRVKFRFSAILAVAACIIRVAFVRCDEPQINSSTAHVPLIGWFGLKSNVRRPFSVPANLMRMKTTFSMASVE